MPLDPYILIEQPNKPTELVLIPCVFCIADDVRTERVVLAGATLVSRRPRLGRPGGSGGTGIR